MITITYITITYNASAVIRRTLDSVLQQDYPHIEHIIVDGASTDDTLLQVEAYRQESDSAGNGHVIHVTSEPDKGIYDAMNKGLRSAVGHYLCFLNAGDYLPATDTVTRIINAVRAVQKDDTSSVGGDLGSPYFSLPAVLYGDTDVVDADGHFLYHRRLSPPEKLTWRSFRHGMLVCHQAFYARVDFAVANPFDVARYRYSADVDWCIRVMRQADSEGVPMLNLHIVVANYLNEGTTTRNHRASLIERFHVMRRHYGLLVTVAMHAWFVIRVLIPKS